MDSQFALLKCKDYVKLVLIDKNLTWRPHIDHIASKISKIQKIVGIIARLRHHVPLNLPFADISLHALRCICLGPGISM